MRTATLVLALVLAGCGTPATVTTPPAPNSPQTQALNVTKTLADSINAAVKTTIAFRDQGKVSQADTTTIENWARSAAILDDAIAGELGSTDTWTVQKKKILLLLPGFKIPGTSATDQTIQAALATVNAIVNQLQAVTQ